MKGYYYKKKTKKFFENLGYYCDYLEQIRTVRRGKKVIYIKKDILGSDLIAINGKEICFIQVKSGSYSIKKVKEEFSKYPFPECKCIRLLLVIWQKRKREPKIIECDNLGATDN
jgi:hypothetical protein